MIRVASAAWWLQIRLLTTSPFFLGIAFMTPLAYLAIALLIQGEDGSPARVTEHVIGAGLMGAWSATLYGAGEALYMQRWTGTLQLLVAAPRSLVGPVVGFSAAAVTLGGYSVVAVWVLARWVFGVSLTVQDGLAVAAGLVMCLLALSAIGMVLAAYYVLSRQALTVSNMLEYPIWIASGLLISTSVLWSPVVWVGKLLPFGWAVDVVHRGIAGEPYVSTLAMSVLVTSAYVGLGVFLLHRVDHAVRRTGRLGL